MASKCNPACIRALQRQAKFQVNRAPAFARRSFTTTQRACVTLPEPNATPASSVQPVQPATGNVPKSFTEKELSSILKNVKGAETYTAYGVTQELFKKCSSIADYKIPHAGEEDYEVPTTADGEEIGVGGGWWHKDLHLPPTFSTWSQVSMLHMYLLSARFRCFSAEDSKLWQQHLLDHFFYDAENRMQIYHNMQARSTRNKYLKDLFVQWRGLLFAYDEGLIKGDAVLAAAIWRNVFKAKSDVDVRGLAAIVGYMRQSLMQLDAVSDEALKMGAFNFADASEQCKTVQVKSPLWDEPISKEIEDMAEGRAAQSNAKVE